VLWASKIWRLTASSQTANRGAFETLRDGLEPRDAELVLDIEEEELTDLLKLIDLEVLLLTKAVVEGVWLAVEVLGVLETLLVVEGV
jgi:hypothetical protein